nr:uncharacterized protein LOC102072864 [Zonotrichia albicollis]
MQHRGLCCFLGGFGAVFWAQPRAHAQRLWLFLVGFWGAKPWAQIARFRVIQGIHTHRDSSCSSGCSSGCYGAVCGQFLRGFGLLLLGVFWGCVWAVPRGLSGLFLGLFLTLFWCCVWAVSRGLWGCSSRCFEAACGLFLELFLGGSGAHGGAVRRRRVAMVKLFIGNLPREATEQEIRSLFEQYGKVLECDIIKNYGFVHIEDRTAAEDAIRNLHHHKLHGVCINVEASKNKSKASTKLHVGNISPACTNLELRAKFEEYGPVIECDIVKDYAFVHMERAEDAVEAIRGLDNTEFQGELWGGCDLGGFLLIFGVAGPTL